MRVEEETEIDRARRLVAGADRAKETIEKARKLIEEFYGLTTEYGKWYDDLRTSSFGPRQSAVEIKLMTTTGHQVAQFELWWGEDGLLAGVSPGKNRISGVDEIIIALRKLGVLSTRVRF